MKKTTKSNRKARTSKNLVAVLLVLLVALLIFSKPVKSIVGTGVFVIATIVVALLTVLAVMARMRKTTISGLIKAIVPVMEREGDDEDEEDEDDEDEAEVPDTAEEADGEWAPVIEIDNDEEIIYLKAKDGKIKSRPIPPKGKKYNKDLVLVDLPKSTEELLSELLENQKKLEKRLEALEKKSTISATPATPAPVSKPKK